MAIVKTQKNGETIYFVRVDRKSKTNDEIRVYKQRSNILTYEEAKKVEQELVDEAVREVVARENRGQSWAQLVRDWEEALYNGWGADRPLQMSTIIDNIAALDKFTGEWNERPAASISRVDVRQLFLKMQQEGKSRHRCKAVKNAMNGCFRWAIDYGKVKGLVQSPANGILIEKSGEDKKPDILTLAEIRKLLDVSRSVEHPWYPIWAAALHTGMRSGELHSLTWDDIDFENRKLTVNKSWNPRFKKVKTTKSSYWRDVPINKELETLLKELKLQAGSRVHVFPRFTDWDRGEAARVLRQFCAGTGLKSIKFHALRACFATQLLRANVAPVTVMRVCGWRELKTMQCYVRLSGIEIDGATDKLQFISTREAVGKVIELFGKKS
jgi:integrase